MKIFTWRVGKFYKIFYEIINEEYEPGLKKGF